jgi:hypothetical protein
MMKHALLGSGLLVPCLAAQSQPFWEKALEDPTAAGTIAIAAFTVLLVIVGGIQSWLLRKSVDAMREDFVATHRPRLILRDAFSVPVAGNELIEVDYSITNVGGSRCIIVRTALDVVEDPNRHSGLKQHPAFTDRQLIGEAFAAGETKEFHFRAGIRWPADRIQWMDDAVGDLVFCGHINYQDRSSRPANRRMAFYRGYSYAAQRFLKRADTPGDLDYSD